MQALRDARPLACGRVCGSGSFTLVTGLRSGISMHGVRVCVMSAVGLLLSGMGSVSHNNRLIWGWRAVIRVWQGVQAHDNVIIDR